MKFKKIEKALMQPFFCSLTELSLITEVENNNSSGYVFSFYQKETNMLKLGYEESKLKLLKGEKEIQKDLFAKRSASVRELKLLKATLKELLFQLFS